MLKKIFITFLLFISTSIFFGIENSLASSSSDKYGDIGSASSPGTDTEIKEAPVINCVGLPGCMEGEKTNPTNIDIEENMGADFVRDVISLLIQIVSVFAVFAVIFSGILYMLSAGNEDKANKAKKWIIWSLLGVFLSISAWGIIELLNNLQIG